MYRTAICDDELVFAEQLRIMLKRIFMELGVDNEIMIYTSAIDLFRDLKKEPDRYHLLLLDILLGNQNGVEFAKILRNTGAAVSILFVSSAIEFALEGYSVDPINYLIKPVSSQELFKIIKKEYFEKFRPRYITFPENGGERVMELINILYIEVLNRKILVHTKDHVYQSTGILKDFLQAIPGDVFVQCHKSFVVNMAKINKLSRTGLLLNNGMSVPVGRAYYQNIVNKFIYYFN